MARTNSRGSNPVYSSPKQIGVANLNFTSLPFDISLGEKSILQLFPLI